MGRRWKLYLLVCFLVAAHLLYAPAWQAGWTRDVSGWLELLHTKSFGDYLLRRGPSTESLYPFSQWMLWFWWKSFGIHLLPWHLLMVSLQAVCAWGWALFYSRIFRKNEAGIFAGLFVLLSPYATEVVVWQAGYHYLQGMALLLATLFCLLRFLDSGKKRWLALGLLAFLPTLFALEVFYLAPVYVLLLLSQKQLANATSRRQAVLLLVLPMLLLIGVQYLLFRWFYHQPVPHIGSLNLARMSDYLRKPAKYIFHLFFFGRYWPESLREKIYEALNSWAFLLTFYPVLLVLLNRHRRTLQKFPENPAFIPVSFGMAALLLVMPLYFQQAGLVDFDRYAYFMLPAVGALFAIYFRKKVLRLGILALSAALLLYTNLLWRESDALGRKMLAQIPEFPDGKPTILLNIPNALRSVPIIGQTQEGEAALMRKYILQKPFSGTVLEPSACNLFSVEDIAIETRWQDAQRLEVTQLQGGGWWSGGVLSTDWENDLFTARFFPEKHAYALTLKKPAAHFHLLRWNGSSWVEIPRLVKSAYVFEGT